MKGEKSFNFKMIKNAGNAIYDFAFSGFPAFLCVWIGTIGVTMSPFLFFGIKEADRDNLVADFMTEMKAGKPYTFASGATIVLNDAAEDTSIAYNFRERIVTIDGPDEADRVMTFAELGNPQAVEMAKSEGCRMSASTKGLLKKFKETVGTTYEEKQDYYSSVKAIEQYAPSFGSTYCEKGL